MNRHDELAEMLAEMQKDWEQSCRRLERVVNGLIDLEEALAVWQDIRQFSRRLDRVESAAAYRCDALSGRVVH